MTMPVRTVHRVVGGLLVAGFVSFFGHIMTIHTVGAGAFTLLFVYVYGILIFCASIGLYLTFRPHEETLALFGGVGIAAHAVLVIVTLAVLLAGVHYPDQFATFGADAPGAASALELTMDKMRTSAFVFLGLAMVPLGLLIARSGAVNRWIGWLGLIGGGVGFLTMFARLFEVSLGGLTSMLFMPAVLGVFGFQLILGVRLAARGVRPPVADG